MPFSLYCVVYNTTTTWTTSLYMNSQKRSYRSAYAKMDDCFFVLQRERLYGPTTVILDFISVAPLLSTGNNNNNNSVTWEKDQRKTSQNVALQKKIEKEFEI